MASWCCAKDLQAPLLLRACRGQAKGSATVASMSQEELTMNLKRMRIESMEAEYIGHRGYADDSLMSQG